MSGIPSVPETSIAIAPSAAQTRARNLALSWGFGLLILVTYLATLGMSPLIEPDEPRYAEIAREMVESGDWLTPHLNYVKYFEKPPLVYWLTASAMKLFGSGEMVLRLWPALCGLIGIVCAWLLARQLYGKDSALLAAAILATTPLYFGVSQVLILDMPLTACMTLALTAAWFIYADAEPRSVWRIVFYLACAAGVLTKGPVTIVLVGAILVAFAALRRHAGYLRRIVWWPGIVLFLLAVLPWFVLVTWRNPEFFNFFVVDQHINRYLRPSEHKQSLFFFVPVIVLGMLPWSVLVLSQPRVLLEKSKRLITLRAAAGTMFCVIWASVIFVFFSISGSKLATYIVPVLCPLAVLMAGALARPAVAQNLQIFRWLGWFVCSLAPAPLIALAVIPFTAYHYRLPMLATDLALASAALGLFGYALLAQTRSPEAPYRRLLATVTLGMMAVQTLVMGARDAGQQYTDLAEVIRTSATPDDLVVLYEHYTQGIPFYARRRVVMVRSWGELDFGSRQGDHSDYFWKEDDRLLEAWRSDKHVFLLINRDALPHLQAQLEPAPREIAAQGKKQLVVNFPAS